MLYLKFLSVLEKIKQFSTFFRAVSKCATFLVTNKHVFDLGSPRYENPFISYSFPSNIMLTLKSTKLHSPQTKDYLYKNLDNIKQLKFFTLTIFLKHQQ